MKRPLGRSLSACLADAWFGGTTLTLKPIRALIDASAKLGKGDLSTRTAMEQLRGGIGQLAGAIDQMADAIQVRDAERIKSQQTRALLAAIVESSSDAIISRTHEGICTSWNKGAQDLFGYSADEIIGNSLMVLVPEDQVDRVLQNFDIVKRGSPIDSYEAVRIRKNGTTVDVSVTVSAIIAEDGRVIGAASIMRDISEHKRSERELRALHEINLAISSTLDRQAILQILLEKIELLLPYSASHIRLVNEATGKLTPVACRNLDETAWKAGDSPSEGSILNWILRSRQPVVLRNLHAEKRFRRPEFYHQQGLVSYLGLPLMVNEEAIGVLSLLTKEEHEFTQDEIRFAQTLAKQASIVIYHSQLYEETKSLAEKLEVGGEHIRALASGLIRARDEEARRIANILHDESGQILAMVYISLDELAKGLSDSDRERVQRIKNLLDEIENRLRDLSHNLHPALLDHLGLAPSLENLAAQISKRSGIQTMIHSQLNGRLPPPLELTLYRVLQEAISNAVRHSRGKTIRVRLLENNGLVQCAIQDDGIGFQSASLAHGSKPMTRGLGIPGMRERIEAIGGTFQILSSPGEGTKLYLSIPLEKPNDAANPDC